MSDEEAQCAKYIHLEYTKQLSIRWTVTAFNYKVDAVETSVTNFHSTCILLAGLK